MMFVWRTFKLAFVELATRLIGLTPLELLSSVISVRECFAHRSWPRFWPLWKGDYAALFQASVATARLTQ